MIGQDLGPYTIEAELGSGGMGTVYRATGPDGAVALKVVHPHLLATAGFFKRFLREARIGKAVRHPNVVRTLDCDALGDHHFLVMELVEGKSLRDLLADLGTIPETLLREIALQTAAGLAAIHAAGIVHRDLKPENILITDDHEIRIMDLGVAKLREASIELTREGQFAGSLLYAAPEQFQGDRDVSPASDLYSLGVLLYELVTGENPFRRDDTAALIQAHLDWCPPSVHECKPRASRFLAEVLARLLAKEPTARFGSAEELRRVFEHGERSGWWTELVPRLREREAHLPRIRVRREARLHGRRGDLEALERAWENARRGRGNTVWIDGEAGIGKTRLVAELVRGIEGDAHVLYGSYPPSGGMGGLSDAILAKFGEVDLAAALAPYLTVTPSLVPAFAALVRHETPPTGSEPLQGDSLSAVCVHLMRALAAEKPLLWIIEDLHFAPKETLGVLLSLARAAEGHRVLIVATARPGVPDEAQAGFSRLENSARRQLARLGAREVIELLQDAFRGEALADRLGATIALKSDGVPFFVFEMIRGLKEGQFISEQADGTWIQTQAIADIEVPSAVKDLIEGRLRGLTEDQRAILDAGAVQGIEFDPELIAAIMEERPVRVLRTLAEIERRSGLVAGEGDWVRFDQNQIQEVLHGQLLPKLRREYHMLLAEAHAKRLGGEPSAEDAVFLASHHLRGSRPAAALPHLSRALDYLAGTYRNEAAIELAARALDRPGLLEGKDRVQVLVAKAWRHALRGEHEAQRPALDEARALADEIGDASLRAKVRVSLGAHLLLTGDYPGIEECSQQALALAREAGDRKTEERATRALGIAFYHCGRYEEARERWEASLALACEIGDDDTRAANTINLGNLFLAQGRRADARDHYRKGLELARQCGNRLWEKNALTNLGVVSLAAARYEDAAEQHGRALTLARELGDRSGEARAMMRIGESRAAQGRQEEARTRCQRARDLAREIGDRELEGYALANLADIAEAEGDAPGAERLLLDSIALRRELGTRSTVAHSLVALGRIERARGDFERAAAHLDEALALGRELKEPETILRAIVKRAYLPGGDVAAASAALEELQERVGPRVMMESRFGLWELTGDRAHLDAASRLLDRALDHTPDEHREAMIGNVPLHRGILQARDERTEQPRPAE